MKWDELNSFKTDVPIIQTDVPIISSCSANQWTGFYMIEASVMKELIESNKSISCYYSSFELLIPVEHWLLPPGN